MIILSNHADCINITTTDRRYSFIPSSALRRGAEHRGWWADIRYRLMTQETGDNVYTWLSTLENLPDPTIPLSNNMRRQVQEISKPSYRLFIEQKLQEFNEANWWISKDQLYGEYRKWCQDNGHASILSVNRFHGKVEELTLDDLQIDGHVTAGIKPCRKDNTRGYGPKHA